MKQWFNTNIAKITLALASVGAVTGTIGLIVSSISYHKTSELSYFLNHDYTVTWGGTTIWSYSVSDKHKISLYFSPKPKNKNDIKWDGIYPDGYFNN